MKDRISVIIPVYNAKEYIEGCVQSIVAQTYPNLEIILVDDGSGDGSAQEIQAMTKYACQEEDRQILVRCISQDNRGVSAARNAGIDAATGAFITFVDADDYLKRDMLEILHRNMLNTDCEISGCGFEMTDMSYIEQKENDLQAQTAADDLGKANAVARDDRPNIMSGEQLIADGILAGDTRCWSKLYCADCVKKASFPEGVSIGEDMLFLLHCYEQGLKLCVTDYKGYCYYKNPKGAMETDFKPSFMDQIGCWEEVLSWTTQMYDDDALWDKSASIVMISTMLVVGKLAKAIHKDRARKKEWSKYIEVCKDTMKRMKADYPHATKLLDRGYKLKTGLFSSLPGLYMWLYGMK